MSNFAYKDRERTIKVLSQDEIESNINIRFYCPNVDCDAHIYVCRCNGSKLAYFKAKYPKYNHIENCPYYKINTFYETNYNENKFDYNSAIENLMSPESKNNNKTHITNMNKNTKNSNNVLKTIGQIHDMCISQKCEHKYNNIEIRWMLLDDRSARFYTKDVFGIKIIKGTFYKYGDEEKTISLYPPVGCEAFNICLKFKCQDLYSKAKSLMFNNKNNFIIAAGNWKGANNKFTAEINSKKQYKVIKA